MKEVMICYAQGRLKLIIKKEKRSIMYRLNEDEVLLIRDACNVFMKKYKGVE